MIRGQIIITGFTSMYVYACVHKYVISISGNILIMMITIKKLLTTKVVTNILVCDLI